MTIRVLRMAVDTLEFSAEGLVRPNVLAALESAKARAQETEHPQYAPLHPFEFVVRDHGAKPFRYVLAGDEITIRVSHSDKIPGASVRLSALGLALYDPETLYELARDCVAEWIGPSAPPKLSRLDIAVDFQGFDPASATDARFVSPAVWRVVMPNTDNPETFQFGRGKVVVRVYNKTRELLTSRKEWLRAVWENCEGYDPNADVWRFEVQYRREALKELGCDTPEAAFARLPELMRYGLSWTELRVPVGESSDRWPVHPAWVALGEATGTDVTLTREAHSATLASLAHIVPAVAGYTISAGADLKCYDFETTWGILGEKVRAALTRESDFSAVVHRRRLDRLGKGD